MKSEGVIFVVDDNLPLLLLGKNVATGGASVQAYSWLRGFAQSNYKVKIISNKIKSTVIDNNEVIGVPNFNKSIAGLLKKRQFLKKLIEVEKPKFIFVTVAGINVFLWGYISHKTNTFYIQRISNDIVFNGKEYSKKIGMIKYILARYNLKYVDLFLCQNVKQKSNLLRYTSIEKIRIFHNPFFINHALEVPKKNNRSYIAWIGIFQHQKNMRTLYDIALSNPDMIFKIAGKPLINIDKNSLDDVELLKTLSNVIFVGFLDRIDIIKFLSKAYCLLNTSLYEGFSNTYLEAFSVGTPVITTINTDPDSIISNYGLGVVVKEYKDLSASIAALPVSDSFDYDKIKTYLSNNHDPETIVQNLLKEIILK